jgi:hypothetical protein
MGLAANTYDLFYSVAKTVVEPNDWAHKEMLDFLKGFSLQSIIIYDPVKDPGFAKMLEKDFLFFDQLTGSKMLFLTILKEGSSSLQHNRRFLPFMDKFSWHGQNVAVSVDDISMATQTLCAQLNLDYDYSPYIIITNNLKNNWFGSVTLDEDNLARVMMDLSHFAGRIDSNTSKNNFYAQLGSLSPKTFLILENQEIGNNSLAKLLSQFLLVTTPNENSLLARDKREKANIFIKYSEEIIKSFAGHGKDIIRRRTYTQLEHKLLSLSGLYSLAKQNEKAVISDVDIWKDFFEAKVHFLEVLNEKEEFPFNVNLDSFCLSQLEIDSKNRVKQLKTLSKIRSLFRHTNDFSFYTILIAKTFEKEINYSMGQLARNMVKIEMPDYFAKLKPDNDLHGYLPDNLKLVTPKYIPLNKPYRQHWQPPGLGETKIVIESMYKKYPNFFNKLISSDGVENLQDCWHHIHQVRNITAHGEAVTIKDCERMVNAFNQLSQSGLLKVLINIKQKLSRQIK